MENNKRRKRGIKSLHRYSILGVVSRWRETDQRIDSALEDSECNESKQTRQERIEDDSGIRNIIHAVKDIVDKTAHNMKLQTKVKETKRELQAYRDAHTPVAPSIEGTEKPETSTTDEQRLHSDRKTKSYSDVVAGRENNRKFKITIRSKGSHTMETMKELIKIRINPTKIKVGISTFKALKDGRILIEVDSNEEREKVIELLKSVERSLKSRYMNAETQD